MNELDMKRMKSALYAVLKDIKAYRFWDYSNQPWLSLEESEYRSNTSASRVLRRAGQKGEIRSLSISDLGTVLECQRVFSASYAAVSVGSSSRAYEGKSGTVFHAEIQKLLPEWFITEQSEKKKSMGKLNYWDRTNVRLESIGLYTDKETTRKNSDGFWGKIDGFMEPFETGFELKSVPVGASLPDELPMKALGQAAGYAHGINTSSSRLIVKAWVWVYLPQDLRDFVPEDPTTYRVFVKTIDELRSVWSEMYPVMKKVADLVDTHGYFDANQTLPACERDECPTCGERSRYDYDSRNGGY